MEDKIRELIALHAGLPSPADVPYEADLYRAGMKSFASVQLMLAVEEAFDVEFPEALLNRATFRSMASIGQAVNSLRTHASVS
jgi:acyl carrier protein